MITVTAVVVLAEALLLRGATRVFIHIPGVDVTSGLAGVITEGARLAFRMAVPLTFALLVLLGLHLWASERGRPRAVSIGVFLGAAVVGRFDGLSFATDWLVLGVVTAVATSSLLRLEGRARIPIAAWSAAFLMSGVVHVLDQRVADGLGTLTLPWLGEAAEALALLALLATPLLLRNHLSRLDWLIGTGIATVLAVALLNAEGLSAARILFLWNLGLSGGYPVILYAVAFGSLGMTIAALIRHRCIASAAALVFMSAAGFGIFSSYQTALFVAGLILTSPRSHARSTVG